MDTVVDTSRESLLEIRFEQQPSLETFNEVFARLERELQEKHRLCVLANAESTTRLELVHVKRIAQFGEQHHEELGSQVSAMAFVIPSAMVRGALKVAFELKAPPHPVKICKSLEEAQEFLEPYLEALS